MPFTDEDKHLALLQRETPEFTPRDVAMADILNICTPNMYF